MNVAYSKGYQDFYGRDFLVTPDVLIPRPEPEQIVDTLLDLAGKSYLPGVRPNPCVLPEKPVILDVGTGSGCVAVTLALELPEAKVYASDISEAALEIAKKNASKFDASISFIISHLLEKVNFTPDVVVANLPYVDESWDWLDKKTLSEEPAIALYAEDHGLALIKQLIDQASNRQIKYLILEADPCQHDTIINYSKAKKYTLLKTAGYILSFEYQSI